MDSRERACLVESNEEDEDGNLSEGNYSSPEASMGESDEEYVAENLSEYSSDRNEDSMFEIDEKNEDNNLSEDDSRSTSARSKISIEEGVVPEDSSIFQLEEKVKKESLHGDGEMTVRNKSKTQGQMRLAEPTGKKKINPTNVLKETSTKVINKASKKGRKNFLYEENSKDSTVSQKENFKTRSRNNKFAKQPTPLCDTILKDHLTSTLISEKTVKKITLRSTKKNNNSKNITSPNKIDKDKGDQSEYPQLVRKIDPDSLHTEHSKSDTVITNLLLVKKEDAEIKQEVSDEIEDETNDGDCEDLKPFSIDDKSTDLVKSDECQEVLLEDHNVNELRDSNVHNKRKRRKSENSDDDPSYSPQTKKRIKVSHTKAITRQQEKSCVPTNAVSDPDDTQSIVTPKRKRGRPPKSKALLLGEINEESKNDLLFDSQGMNEKDPSAGTPKVLSGLGKIGGKGIDPTSFNLQPYIILIPCDLNDTQPIASNKIGRLSKINDTEPSQGSQKSVVPISRVSRSAINHNSNEMPGTDNLELPVRNPDLSNSLLKLEDSSSTMINQANVFDNYDLSCLQLNDPVISPQTVQMTSNMTAKETNSFIAEYLISHQRVFDYSFFQDILPVISEILIVCMNEFTESIVRIKKSENFTSEKLREQEVKLALQSFCSTVSTYNERFFLNFNSVMYKINQNKTKKGLIIALILFVANSLWIKAPKFKGKIHTLRKMLTCIWKIRKINSPLFFTVLTTPEKMFNQELKLLVEILVVLQKKNVLVIPTTALPESSGIEEMWESIRPSSTDCSNVSDSNSRCPKVATQFSEIIQDKEQRSDERITENLDDILCMLKQNDYETNSETPGKHHEFSLDKEGLLAETLRLDQLGGLDSLLESYLKSASDTNDAINTELDNENGANLRFLIPADSMDNVVKMEEKDCGSPFEDTENTIFPTGDTISTDSDLPENYLQDPLLF